MVWVLQLAGGKTAEDDTPGEPASIPKSKTEDAQLLHLLGRR